MDRLAATVDAAASAARFAGVVRVDVGGRTAFAAAYGLADRRHRIPMTLDTQLAVASGAKTFTALTVMSLIVDGTLDLTTPARTVLGDDLPLIGGDVTVEHLLGHRSGIGDYLDEDTLTRPDDYVLTVPVHRLERTESYLGVLDGLPAKFPAGTGFSYCNSGYVILALIAERVGGAPFHVLVHERVCRPAGLKDSAYLRSDSLPGRAAVGYVEVDGSWRSNVLHLPVIGTGDGGIYTTVADVHRLWHAVFAGLVVPPATVADMIRPRSTTPSGRDRYGLGFWLDGTGPGVRLEGCDAGVSFAGRHDPVTGVTWTVIGNTSDGAWPLARALHAGQS